MISMTATTNENGTMNISLTNGDITIDRKGNGLLRVLIAALIAMKIAELKEVLEAFHA